MQSNQPFTFVVVTLDPPIRKGQTLYPHIVLQVSYCCLIISFCGYFFNYLSCVCVLLDMQFETDYVVDSTLSMSEDLLRTKYKDKLEPTYKAIHSGVKMNFRLLIF